MLYQSRPDQLHLGDDAAALTNYVSDPIFSILKNMSVWQIHNYTMRNSIDLPKVRYLYKRIKKRENILLKTHAIFHFLNRYDIKRKVIPGFAVTGFHEGVLYFRNR